MAEILVPPDPSTSPLRYWRGSPWSLTDSEQQLQPGGSLPRPVTWARTIRRLSTPENFYHRPLTSIHTTVSARRVVCEELHNLERMNIRLQQRCAKKEEIGLCPCAGSVFMRDHNLTGLIEMHDNRALQMGLFGCKCCALRCGCFCALQVALRLHVSVFGRVGNGEAVTLKG